MNVRFTLSIIRSTFCLIFETIPCNLLQARNIIFILREVSLSSKFSTAFLLKLYLNAKISRKLNKLPLVGDCLIYPLIQRLFTTLLCICILGHSKLSSFIIYHEPGSIQENMHIVHSEASWIFLTVFSYEFLFTVLSVPPQNSACKLRSAVKIPFH